MTDRPPVFPHKVPRALSIAPEVRLKWRSNDEGCFPRSSAGHDFGSNKAGGTQRGLRDEDYAGFYELLSLPLGSASIGPLANLSASQ